MYFLDSNTCIDFLNGRFESIKEKILSTPPVQIKIPSFVKAELLLGAYKSQQRESNLEKIEAFLNPFEIILFEDQMAYVYTEIRFNMETSGNNVGPNDLLIASIVKFHDGVLITNNVKEFNNIEGLRTKDWTKK